MVLLRKNKICLIVDNAMYYIVDKIVVVFLLVFNSIKKV